MPEAVADGLADPLGRAEPVGVALGEAGADELGTGDDGVAVAVVLGAGVVTGGCAACGAGLGLDHSPRTHPVGEATTTRTRSAAASDGAVSV